MHDVRKFKYLNNSVIHLELLRITRRMTASNSKVSFCILAGLPNHHWPAA